MLIYELDGVPHEHALSGQRVVIGRAKDCDLCLAFNAEVSRLHATLTATPKGWVVEDMSSRLGTLVNGERIGDPRRLGDRDVLQIGQVAMTLREKKHGSETVSLGSEARGDFLAAADAAAPPVEPDSNGSAAADAPAEEPQPGARESAPLHAPPVNFYELVGVDDFEPDLAKIQEAAKSRMRQLRSGSAAGSHAEQQAQVDAIAAGLAAMGSPDKRRAYDLELAERLGIEVEVRGERVVPVGSEGIGQLTVGLVILGAVIIVLWLGLPYLRAALGPLLEGR